MTAARKIIAGFGLRVFPHAVAGLMAKGIFGLNGDSFRGLGGN